MKKLLTMVPIVALVVTGFVPAVQATGLTTSGQESGSGWCSGGDAELDPGAVGLLEAGEADWYSVTADEPVVIRMRASNAQFHTGITWVLVADWDPAENTCVTRAFEDNTIIGSDPIPLLGCCLPQASNELGPLPPGQYQVRVNTSQSNNAPTGYVLTATSA